MKKEHKNIINRYANMTRENQEKQLKYWENILKRDAAETNENLYNTLAAQMIACIVIAMN